MCDNRWKTVEEAVEVVQVQIASAHLLSLAVVLFKQEAGRHQHLIQVQTLVYDVSVLCVDHPPHLENPQHPLEGQPHQLLEG